MIVIYEEVGHENHGLDRADGGFVEVGTHSQGLVSRGDIELGSLLSFSGRSCGDELGAHC